MKQQQQQQQQRMFRFHLPQPLPRVPPHGLGDEQLPQLENVADVIFFHRAPNRLQSSESVDAGEQLLAAPF